MCKSACNGVSAEARRPSVTLLVAPIDGGKGGVHQRAAPSGKPLFE